MGLAFACLAGAIFGLHFNVVVLALLTLVEAAIYLAANALFGEGARLGYLSVLIVSLQAGYFAGLTGRDVYTDLIARFFPKSVRRV
ncbi:hypothetical protein [Bradyrhizobium sp. Tv2a-2]|uniref:hypothetical protein n=1 Tax=Bradyrhizobium sp. Tv2a-2 TaxID=113395 RepID=UPI0003FB358B|nr:hypothetical protein [Bradyrhizobium sp. Tv2a-2]